MEDINYKLYHGSRNGIEGDIKPTSRPNCDFGKGFYMGNVKMQAKSLVADCPKPMLYQVSFKLSKIPENKILVLEGKSWLYAVLASRKMCKEFNKLSIAKEWRNELKKYDVIIGAIADDAMVIALKAFNKNELTDEGLLACMKEHSLGTQYVAKTEFACKMITHDEGKPIYGAEAQEAKWWGSKKAEENIKLVNKMKTKYKDVGKYLKDIIKEEKLKEAQKRKG